MSNIAPEPLYELIYGTMHCTGKKIYSAGTVTSRKAAEDWVRSHQNGQGRRLSLPEQDPVCWCPVRHCHMKRQKPWVDFRLINQGPDSESG